MSARATEGLDTGMTKVIWHTMMSLDGYIAGPDDSMEWAFEQPGGSCPRRRDPRPDRRDRRGAPLVRPRDGALGRAAGDLRRQVRRAGPRPHPPPAGDVGRRGHRLRLRRHRGRRREGGREGGRQGRRPVRRADRAPGARGRPRRRDRRPRRAGPPRRRRAVLRRRRRAARPPGAGGRRAGRRPAPARQKPLNAESWICATCQASRKPSRYSVIPQPA